MPMLTKHPCNTFNGWLYVTREEATAAHTQQLRLRDQQLEEDPRASGEPPAFRAWAIAQVRRIAGEERIARQIRAHQSEVQLQLQRLGQEEQLQAQRWAEERQKLMEELELLADLQATSTLTD